MKNYKSISIITVVFIVLLGFSSCDKNENFVLFSVQDDIDLGQQVSQEINNDPKFDLLSRTDYPEAYNYLDGMVSDILNTGEVEYKEEFAWDVTIIHDDSTLNAFATPGGYIYVYTGLIKYLDNADDLAGVLGHEIAHADLRHTSRNLQKQYGVQILLSIVLGKDPNTLEQIAGQVAGTVAGLSFSRDFEAEADDKSVVYLAATNHYACDGAASFFEKLESSGQSAAIPEFLSTHPPSDERIVAINAKADEIGCDTSLSGDDYQGFKDALPQ